MGFIYKITNKENGKIYIGKTVNTIQERWHEHISEAFNGNISNSLIHKAIVKYGIDAFLVEEIGEFLEIGSDYNKDTFCGALQIAVEYIINLNKKKY